MSRPTLSTVRRAAQTLGISEKAVRCRIARGQLPSVRIGRSIYVPHLEAWLAERTLPAITPVPRPRPRPAPATTTDPALEAIADLMPTERVF